MVKDSKVVTDSEGTYDASFLATNKRVVVLSRVVVGKRTESNTRRMSKVRRGSIRRQ